MNGLSNISRSRGQAAVFVLLFLGVLILSLIFVYKAGKVTTERMQVQNAADAVAYSVSTIEARDLNFLAYTNRAMVANEVAIGQMVGLMSWMANLESYAYYLGAYYQVFIEPLVSAASLGTATGPVRGIFTGFKQAFISGTQAVQNVLRPVINIAITVMTNINKVFGYAQTGFHYSTIAYALSAALPNPINGEGIIPSNAPGAKVSDFGIFSMLMHTVTYASFPGAPSLSIPIPGAPSEVWFTRTYKPTGTGDTDKDGYQRFAGIVNASKDDFSRQRGWEIPLPVVPKGLIDFTGSDRFEIDLVIATIWLEVEFYLEFALEREGGSELRYRSTGAKAKKAGKCPPGYEPGKGGVTGTSSSGTSGTGTGTTSTSGGPPSGCVAAAPGSGDPPDPEPGNKYSWSAADATELAAELKFYLAAGIDTFLGSGSASLTIELANGFAGGALSLPIVGELFSVSIPFPTGAPFSSGSAQAAKAANKLQTPDIALVGTDSYGGAPTNRGAWIPFAFPAFIGSPSKPYIAPAVPVVSLTMPTPTHTVNKTYAGLPFYTDTQSDHLRLGFLAPYYMSGVVKEMDDINATGPRFGSLFTMDEGAADSEVAAIAKSSVYFKRPNDLSYFAREDGQEEYASAFNPYWQARLVETTNMDRFISLGIQQKQALIGFGNTNLSVLNFSNLNPVNWLP